MKRALFIIILLADILFAAGQTTRYWVGGSSGNFTDGTKWSSSSGGSPIGGTISWSNTDIARFDVNSGSTTVYFTASETIGKLQISGNITVKMQNLYAYSYNLTIRTAATDALTVASWSTLEIQGNYDKDMTVQLYSSTGITANISGTVRVLPASGNTGIGQFEKGSSATINFNSGSFYYHNVNGDALPVANWNAGSTCSIQGITNNTPSNYNQQFGHFIWNCSSQSAELSFAGNFGSVQGNLSIQSTNSQILKFSTTETCTINVGGHFSLGGNSYLILSGGSADNTMNVNGDFSLTGGAFVMCAGTGYTTLNVKGNFSMSASNPVFSQNPSYNRATMNFNGTSTQLYTKSSGTIYYGISFNVKTGATLDLGSSVLGDYLYTTGSFTIESGASLKTSHAEGIVSSGASGCIQVAGSRNYNVASNYTFYRNGAQASGYQFPVALEGVLTIGSTSNATNLTITGSTVTINNKLVMVSNSSISSTVSSGNVLYGVSGTLEYQGLSHFYTSNSVFPVSGGPRNVVVSNINGVTLHDSRTIQGNLTINQPSFNIGNYFTLNLQGNLIMNGGGIIAGGINSNLTVSGTGSNMTLPGLTLNNFTLNRANGVTLSGDMIIYGTLALASGMISGNPSLYKVWVINTTSGAISGGSSSSYISLPLVRYLPQSLQTGTYFFPVGKDVNYYPFTLSEVKTGIAGIVQITVEAIQGNCGGTPGSGLATLSTTEFWNATALGGELIQARISAGRPSSLGSLNAIARCSTKTGTYSNLNGTVSGNRVINSDLTGVLDFIVFAEKDCVPPQLNAKYNGEESKEICSGEAYTLSANPTGGAYCSGQWQFAWYTGTGNDNTYWNGSTWNNAETWGFWENISNVSPSVNTTYKVKVRCSTNYNCTSTDATGVEVIVHPKYTFIDINEICQGDSIFWRGNYYKMPGQYFDHLYTQYGCDSIYILRLFVFPKYKFTTFAEICDGDVFSWRGQDYTQEGTYTEQYQSQYGCDSMYVLNLTVHPVYEYITDAEICEGETYTWRGNDYSTAGEYREEYFSQFGCDSVYVLNLVVYPAYEFVTDAEICDGESFNWRGNDYTTTGAYYDSFFSQYGCDSVYVLNLTVYPEYLFVEDVSVYANQTPYEWQGNEYSVTGTYYANYQTVNGCDSIYRLNLTVKPDVPLRVTKNIGRAVMAEWFAIPGATMYQLRYKKTTESTWIYVTQSTQLYRKIIPLDENTDYNLELRHKAGLNWYPYNSVYPAIVFNSGTISFSSYRDIGTKFIVEWTDLDDVSSYVLQYRKVPSSTWITKGYYPSNSAVMGSMEEGTAYQYRICPRYNEASFEWTHPGTIVSNYISISVSNYNGSSADFSWGPVTNPAASDYYLQIREENSSVIFSSNYTAGTSRNVTGLDPMKDYEYRLVVRYDGLAWQATSWRPLVNSKEEMVSVTPHNSLNVYPNPFDHVLVVEISFTCESLQVWNLYDSNGKRVMSGMETLTPGLNYFEIDGSGLATGLYILQSTFNGTVETSRILKQ